MSVVLAVFFIAGFSALVPYGGAIASGLVGVVAGGIGGETSAGWIPKILEWLGDAVGWLAGARSNQNVISDENGSSYENGSSDENVRRFLFVGAFLFTVGFGLLLAAVWIPPQPSKS